MFSLWSLWSTKFIIKCRFEKKVQQRCQHASAHDRLIIRTDVGLYNCYFFKRCKKQYSAPQLYFQMNYLPSKKVVFFKNWASLRLFLQSFLQCFTIVYIIYHCIVTSSSIYSKQEKKKKRLLKTPTPSLLPQHPHHQHLLKLIFL